MGDILMDVFDEHKQKLEDREADRLYSYGFYDRLNGDKEPDPIYQDNRHYSRGWEDGE